MDFFQSLCTPAQINLLFAIVGLAYNLYTRSWVGAILQIAVGFVSTLVLWFFCSIGLPSISWILFFFPLVITVIAFIMLGSLALMSARQQKQLVEEGKVVMLPEHEKTLEKQMK